MSIRNLCPTINTIGNNIGHCCSVFCGYESNGCFYHQTSSSSVISTEEICAICHESNCNFRISCCRAFYHTKCLEALQKSNSLTCPTCREPMNIDRKSTRYLQHDFIHRVNRLSAPVPLETLINKEREKSEKAYKKGLAKIKKDYEKKIADHEHKYQQNFKNIETRVKTKYEYTEDILSQLNMLKNIPELHNEILQASFTLLSKIEPPLPVPKKKQPQYADCYDDEEYYSEG